MSGINEQLALIKDALARARGAGVGGTPIDIAVARQYGDSTVTMRAQVLGSGGSQPVVVPPTASAMAGSAAAPLTRATDNSFYERDPMQEDSEQVATTGVKRTYTTNSFYQDQEAEEVPKLLAEIDRLKRKALSRGVNLTSPQEDVPAEDVAMLKQVFAIADDDGSGEISLEQLKQLHIVLGEPLTDEEAKRAFKAMDSNRSGTVSFDDFLAWYTLAHSRSGMLSKKGNAYTARFKKIMQRLGDAFDVKHLTTFTSGVARSLDFRVQFHYNDNGQLKQISPWHDIPLFSPDGYVHMVTEIPKFSRAKFEIATGENFNPIKQDVKNGKLRDYNYGDMCFNYGALPQTWEDPNHTTPDTGYPGDNDPIDAIEIGYRMLRTGSVTRVKVLGCLAMIDDNETDWKVICISADDPLASQLNDVDDVERVLPGYISVMREWLRLYKTVDGKPENKFALDERAVGRDYTMGVIAETHEFWKQLVAKGTKTV